MRIKYELINEGFEVGKYFRQIISIRYLGKKTTNIHTAVILKEMLRNKPKEFKFAVLYTIYEDLCNCSGIAWIEYQCFRKIWNFFTNDELTEEEFVNLALLINAKIVEHISKLPEPKMSIFSYT